MGSSLDLVIVGVYMCVLVLIGVVFGRLVKSGSDYFKAGAKASWVEEYFLSARDNLKLFQEKDSPSTVWKPENTLAIYP